MKGRLWGTFQCECTFVMCVHPDKSLRCVNRECKYFDIPFARPVIELEPFVDTDYVELAAR